MHFRENAEVITAAGRETVGRIDRVVVDPATDQVSHIVVQKGLLFTEDKVLPVTDIEKTTRDTVILKKGAGSPDHYPKFEEDQFVAVGSTEEFRNRKADEAKKLLWYHSSIETPFGKSSPYPLRKNPLYLKKRKRNIPDGEIALVEGAKVTDRNGHALGWIEDIFTESENFKVTHLLISCGPDKKDKKLIPALWIKHLSDESVQLYVESQIVENIPRARPPLH